jgi:hypothetical protein
MPGTTNGALTPLTRQATIFDRAPGAVADHPLPIGTTGRWIKAPGKGHTGPSDPASRARGPGHHCPSRPPSMPPEEDCVAWAPPWMTLSEGWTIT